MFGASSNHHSSIRLKNDTILQMLRIQAIVHHMTKTSKHKNVDKKKDESREKRRNLMFI